MGRAFIFAALAALAACAPEAAAPPLPAPAAAPASAREIERLTDTAELVALSNALDDARDRQAWAEARALFANQLDVDVSAEKNRPIRYSADALIAQWRRALGPEGQSFHLRGSHVVRLEGDVAVVRSQVYSWVRASAREGAGEPRETWASEEHRLARTAAGWRITALSIQEKQKSAAPKEDEPQR